MSNLLVVMMCFECWEIFNLKMWRHVFFIICQVNNPEKYFPFVNCWCFLWWENIELNATVKSSPSWKHWHNAFKFKAKTFITKEVSAKDVSNKKKRSWLFIFTKYNPYSNRVIYFCISSYKIIIRFLLEELVKKIFFIPQNTGPFFCMVHTIQLKTW